MKRLILILFLLLLPVYVHAGCTIGWVTYTESATEIRLYINGSTSYVKISPITLTSFIIVDSYLPLIKNTMYITAYDAVNVRESVPSNTVTWTRGLSAPQLLMITIP